MLVNRLSILALMCLFLVGCESEVPTLAPVDGTLTQAGKPIAEAVIVLHPQEKQTGNLPKPMAITDSRGKFKLTTTSSGDGALPGKYIVTLELRALRRSGEEAIRDGKHLLPERLADPRTSGMTKEVVPGANHWETIEVPAR